MLPIEVQALQMQSGSTMTIYYITGIVSNSFPLACTPNNITAGFEKTETSPLNVNIFSKHDFMTAYSTGTPNQEPAFAIENLVLSVNDTHADLIISEKNEPKANCSKDLEQFYCHTSFLDNKDVLSEDEGTAILTHEDLRPFKKAVVSKRILNKKGKKKRKHIDIKRFTKYECFKKRKS